MIVGKCICGNPLELDFSFVEEEMILIIKPCSVCIEQAKKELVWSIEANGFILFVPEHGD